MADPRVKSKDRLEKHELADSVIEAATSVLTSILAFRPSRGQMEIMPLQFTRDEVTVITRLSGDLSGEIVMGLTRPTAHGIVSNMLKREVETLGPLEISALAELGSIITDSSLALLEEKGALCYGTWASVIVGTDERISPFAVPSLAVPLRMIVGDLHLNVAVEAWSPFAWSSKQSRLSGTETITVPATPLAADEDIPLAA